MTAGKDATIELAKAQQEEQLRLLNKARELKCSVELVEYLEELEDNVDLLREHLNL